MSVPTASLVTLCLEEDAVEGVLDQAWDGIRHSGRASEVIVVDIGSTERSSEIAIAHGATVVDDPRPGYGSAYLTGLSRAQGEYVVMGDADSSYPLVELSSLVDRLELGDSRAGVSR